MELKLNSIEEIARFMSEAADKITSSTDREVSELFSFIASFAPPQDLDEGLSMLYSNSTHMILSRSFDDFIENRMTELDIVYEILQECARGDFYVDERLLEVFMAEAWRKFESLNSRALEVLEKN